MRLGMLISFREAADLSLQMVLAVMFTITAMTTATYVIKSERNSASPIDAARPSLWTAGPVRIDAGSQAYVREGNGGIIPLSSSTDGICSDAIGLRLSCDLLKTAAF
jgi:hypothetical protein